MGAAESDASEPEGGPGRGPGGADGHGPRRVPDGSGPGQGQLGALIELLLDDSRQVRTAVREELAARGDAGRRALEAAAAGAEPRVRARARQLLAEWTREGGFVELSALVRRPAIDLEEGLGVIDRLLGFGHESTGPALDALAEKLRASLGEEAAFADAGRALARLLGAEEGFRGTSQDYHLVDRVSLARTVETRQGLPLTLSAVYAGVARRVGVEAGLLPFPGHVLVAIGHGPGRVVLDPFASGDEVSREACERRLAELGAPPSPRWLLPATDRDMVVRQIRNLVSAMERHDRIGDARRLRLLLDAAIR